MQPIPLSDAQRTILTAACQCEDRLVFPVTAPLRGGAVGNVLKSLLKRELIEEIPATTQHNVWRHDVAGQALTLRATRLALQVLGIEEVSAGEQRTDGAEPAATPPSAPKQQRSGSKQAALVTMLQRPEGASLGEIVDATGWQAHTVRGAIAGALKKRLGLTITSERIEGRGRVYRIEV